MSDHSRSRELSQDELDDVVGGTMQFRFYEPICTPPHPITAEEVETDILCPACQGAKWVTGGSYPKGGRPTPATHRCPNCGQCFHYL